MGILRQSLLVLSIIGAVRTCPAAEAGPTHGGPAILSIRSDDGKDVPYGKVYGDMDALPIPWVQADAEYPPELRSKGIEGGAIVTFILTAKGEMKDISIWASRAEFAGAALAAAKRSKYRPAEKANKPVDCKMELLYTFPGPFVLGGPHR